MRKLFVGALACIASALSASVMMLFWVRADSKVAIGIGLLPYLFLMALLSVVLLGAPAFAFLLRSRLANARTACLFGFFAGGVVALAVRFPSAPAPLDFFILGAIGTAAGEVFWLAWKSLVRS